MNWKDRTYCERINEKELERFVQLTGWVDAIRDHGDLVFVHLRDVSGICQLVFHVGAGSALHDLTGRLREEWILDVSGTVRKRAVENINSNISTGEFEVWVTEAHIISTALPLPYKISEKTMVFGEALASNPDLVDEELRLTYRFLDLRRPSVQARFKLRDRAVQTIRHALQEKNFIEIETPILTKSTPEGARDFLVPSRIHTGNFYALPQSPQLFKQLLMASGFERYYQIARCFRDEDLRPNRQPEFTQLDIEASFIDEEFIISTVSDLVHKLFTDQGFSLETPFPRMTYEEADNLYGTDKPDLRFAMAFFDATSIFAQTRYGIFKSIIEKGGTIKGICVPGAASRLSKNTLQQEYCQELIPSFGGKGMTWAKVEEDRLQSNIVQFFSLAEQKALIEVAKGKDGDVLLLIADTQKKTVNHVLGKLRLHVASELGLAQADSIKPIWVTEFPLFELKDKHLESVHHPFTAPLAEITSSEKEHLLSLKSRSYDLVVSGEELGGGSMRIHDFRTQEKIFSLLGLGSAQIEEKFGFFLTAFQYGLPPHGGIALGLDRLASMLAGVSSIREVIAFPKNRRAVCPLTKAPGPVDLAQLKELGIDRLEKWMEEIDRVPEKKKDAGSGKERIHLTNDDIDEVAALAMFHLTEYEKTEFQKDLEVILKHADQLLSVDTHHIQPLFRLPQQKGTMRSDESEPFASASNILAEAPELEGAYFKIPRVLNK